MMQLTYRNAQCKKQNIRQACVPTGEIGTCRGAKSQFKSVPQDLSVSGYTVMTYRGALYRSFTYQKNIHSKNTPSKNTHSTMSTPFAVVRKLRSLEPVLIGQYPES